MKLNHAKIIVSRPEYVEAQKTIAEAEAKAAEDAIVDEAPVEDEATAVDETETE